MVRWWCFRDHPNWGKEVTGTSHWWLAASRRAVLTWVRQLSLSMGKYLPEIHLWAISSWLSWQLRKWLPWSWKGHLSGTRQYLPRHDPAVKIPMSTTAILDFFWILRKKSFLLKKISQRQGIWNLMEQENKYLTRAIKANLLFRDSSDFSWFI